MAALASSLSASLFDATTGSRTFPNFSKCLSSFAYQPVSAHKQDFFIFHCIYELNETKTTQIAGKKLKFRQPLEANKISLFTSSPNQTLATYRAKTLQSLLLHTA